MIREELFGKVYYTRFGISQIVSAKAYQSLGCCYLVNDKYPKPAHPNGFGLRIIETEEVEEDLLHQEEYKAKHENSQKETAEYEERQRIKKEKEERE